jgi:hypothetical protein
MKDLIRLNKDGKIINLNPEYAPKPIYYNEQYDELWADFWWSI